MSELLQDDLEHRDRTTGFVSHDEERMLVRRVDGWYEDDPFRRAVACGAVARVHLGHERGLVGEVTS